MKGSSITKELEEGISFKDTYKLVCVAVALNRLLFTASGYLVSSYFSQSKKVAFYKSFSSFLLLEFIPISIWIILGIYYGAKLAVKFPLLIGLIIVFLGVAAWFKKDKFFALVKDFRKYIKEVKSRIILVIPFIILNMLLAILYYFLLFRLFGFYPKIPDILKIVSISISVSYLSPAPTGLGFKETSLIFLLMEKGLVFNNAMTIAILDRVIVTAFWSILGFTMGFDLIKEEIGRRFKRNKRTRDSEVKKALES